jgi:hypothetical protein
MGGGFEAPPDQLDEGVERQLYHMSEDPGETRNLYRSKPGRSQKMLALLRRILGEGGT